jgi:hemolysin activation/secretion protein
MWRCPAVLGLLAAVALRGTAWASLDAGASTFEGQRRRYQPPVFRLEDVVVPEVVVETAPDEEEAGPRFALERFEVSGNTLLAPPLVDDALAAFLGEERKLKDIQAARDALQELYASEGFPAVSVAIPAQKVDSGTVRLEVVEARLGAVEVRNDGVDWFSEEYVRARTPELVPGATLREEDLRSGLLRVNAHPDLRARPLLEPGDEEGTVDLALVVDDRLPLHAGLLHTNDHTPGSPVTRTTAILSYANFWGLAHEASFAYQFVANVEQFNDVQILAGTYRAPMPWNEEHSLLAYYAHSDTANGLVSNASVGILGAGENYGLRYQLPLPGLPGLPSFHHGLVLGIDHKHVENTVQSGLATSETPLTYLPWSTTWEGDRVGEHLLTSFRLGGRFNRAGTVTGGSEHDFQENRGGVEPDNKVTGNYEVLVAGLEQTLRIPSLLLTLAAGQPVDLPVPTRSFFEDWTLWMSLRGQYASQPLVSSEQYAGGGLYSVRGYLQGTNFGDHALNTQIEVRSPRYRGVISRPLGEWARLLHDELQVFFFYDQATLWKITPIPDRDPSDDEPPNNLDAEDLVGFGIGLRMGLFDRVETEIVLARPQVESVSDGILASGLDDNPKEDPGVRVQFEVRASF